MNKLFVFPLIIFLLCISFTKIYAQTAESYADSGFIKFAKQDYLGAIKEYTNAIALNPKNDNYYVFRGYSNLKIRKYKDAILDFSNAIEIKPNYYSYYLNRGSAKQLNGDKEGACLDYKKYMEISGLPPSDDIKQFCE